ncbi:MAG: CoA pyrophosphatase [SAR86 cluster bacterium]|jgi:8-oxo-dGTP pyrophosphatase MutT (NUDIX family)|nr:CoA pyrophosphatase [SAR86 cluster bacterium]MCS5547853.1 CoA pyrophosphatase [SAR86 cluster bacterium]|tara:strand:- start:1815 stop:2441 length:627 start_codon:yes stop_codon:yes gene_type:complete
MLKKIEDNLNKKESTWLDQLSLKQSDPKSDLPKAAVLIALTDEENPEVIYTLRSNKVSSHQGEVSFPGGMQEESDTSLIITALRESEEEIGLPQNCVKILGSLDTMVSRFNVSVTPFVGVIPGDVELNTSSEEIEACFRVPLSFLLKDKRYRNDEVNRNGETFYMPAYKYSSYVIWGLTAMITVNFLNRALDAKIDMSLPSKIEGEEG